MSFAMRAASRLLVAAVAGGVRDIVVCPGSRSQALALVGAELERLGAVRMHVRVDERSAGFFALGIARESGTPVPVITTSGTAVANLHPAMLEAYHAGVPLVALTADRPSELVGTGANQTTVQHGLFGPLVPVTTLAAPESEADIEAAAQAGAALAGARGAWHLNVAFRAPLSAQLPDLTSWAKQLRKARGASVPAAASSLAADQQLAQQLAERLAQRTEGPSAAVSVAAEGLTGAQGDPGSAAREVSPAIPAQTNHNFNNEPVTLASAERCSWPGEAPVVRGFEAAELTIDPADWLGGIVIAGDGAGPAAQRAARQAGWPLVAEVSSGARFGRNLVVAYRELLGAASPIPGLRDSLEIAIVFGHPTLSREITELLGQKQLRVVVVDNPAAPRFAPRPDAEHVASVRVLAFGASRLSSSGELSQLRQDAEGMLAGWVDASRELVARADSDAPAPDFAASRSADLRERARFGREELNAAREPVTREVLVDAVWRHTWPHDRLVLGASRLIRTLDSRAVGKRVCAHANRGLSGIDGTIATALGVAHASQHGDDLAAHAGVTRVLMGDLTFLHDVASLFIGQEPEDAPRVQIIVGNDGGGTIFDGLEVAQTADAAAFDRVMLARHNTDIAAIARAFGWGYRCAATRAQLEQALTDQTESRIVIEVPLPR